MKIRLITLLAFTLLILTGICVWKYWPDDRDKTEEEAGLKTKSVKAPIPTEPYAPLDRVMQCGDSEDQSWALDVADRIARERIALSSSDVQKLMSFIAGEKPASLDDGEWQHRVNSILNALRAQSADNDGLTDLLITMAKTHPDSVLRIYALQHLGSWVPREKNPAKKEEILALFNQLATTPGEATAGTAMQMLTELEQAGKSTGAVNLNAIEQSALRIAADPAASHDLRVTALHTCCDRQLTAVLKDARLIAADTKEITIVRKAAIFAIGKMGSKQDISLLKTLQKESPQLAEAAKPAVKRIME